MKRSAIVLPLIQLSLLPNSSTGFVPIIVSLFIAGHKGAGNRKRIAFQDRVAVLIYEYDSPRMKGISFGGIMAQDQ